MFEYKQNFYSNKSHLISTLNLRIADSTTLELAQVKIAD